MTELRQQIEEFISEIDKDERKTLFLEILRLYNGDFVESKRVYTKFINEQRVTYLFGPLGKTARNINKNLFFKTKIEAFMAMGTGIVLLGILATGFLILGSL